MVVCIALGVDVFRGGTCAPLYIQRDRFIWKVLAEYSWSPTTSRSDSFLCTAASSTPIWIVTREVRHIDELSLTIEHSMPISSPAALGLTSPELFVAESCRRRVLGAVSSSASSNQSILVASGPSFRYVE